MIADMERATWWPFAREREDRTWKPTLPPTDISEPIPELSQKTKRIAEIIDLVGKHPVRDGVIWESNDQAAYVLGVAKGTASKWITLAVKAGVVKRVKVGKRAEIHKV